MFTTGRIIFTLCFLVLFIGVMIYAYRKDMQQVRQWFKRPYLILIAVVAIIGVYLLFTRII